MYKITDFYQEISRRNQLILGNHLFIIVFLFFVVFIGTLSIWFVPLLNTQPFDVKVIGKSILDNMTTLNLLSFCVPLLSVLMLDGCFKIAREKNNSTTTIWMICGLAIGILAIILLFAIGRLDQGFSITSFIAWLITLYIWLLNNIEDQKYQQLSDSKTPSGGGTISKNNLMRGGNG